MPDAKPDAPAVADPAVPATAAAAVDPAAAGSYLDAIRENYSRYVAAGPIPYGNVLAFNTGDPVNADHPQLKQWLSDGLVEDSAKGKRK